MSNPEYEIRVATEPDMNGGYFARVYLGGQWLDSMYDADRDKVIGQAREYVRWHRDRDDTFEVVEL